MDTLAVARYYHVDPDVVDYGWTNADFLDRLEYMLLAIDADLKAQKKLEKNVRN